MAARFWVGGTGTWDNSATTHWSTTSGGANGSAAPTSADTVTFDGNSGAAAVITVNANVTASDVTLGVTNGNFTGTLDFATNNNSPTFRTFSFSGSGARTLNMGSGTWTITGDGNGNTVFDLTTVAGPLTLSAASVNLTLTSTTSAVRLIPVGLNATFGTITVSANTSGGIVELFPSTSITLTMTNLSVAAPNNIIFGGSNSRAYAITNSISLTGSSGSFISLASNTGSTQPTITTANTITASWCAFYALTFAGGGTLNATNSFDLGAVTTSTFTKNITAPSGGGGRMIGG